MVTSGRLPVYGTLTRGATNATISCGFRLNKLKKNKKIKLL